MDHSDPSRGAGRARKAAVLASVCLSVTVIVMDGSIVNVALPTLVRELDGATNSQLQWIVDAYILVFASLLLSAGSAADRLGRRALLVAGLLVFGAMSVGAALCESAGSLITWRALMGVGAAMIFPSTLAIITEEFTDPDERRRAIALWAGSSGLGVAIGPVAGGWLLTHFHWGSVFLVNLPIIALAIAGCLLSVRESRDPEPARFDPLGNVLAVGWIVALVYGLIEGPVLGWGSPPILGSLIGASLLFAVFVRWEARSRHPMLDVSLFTNRRFAGACAAITFAFFGLFGFVFMVTQYFQFIHRYDALQAGLRTLPFAGFILVGAAVAAAFGSESRRRAFSSSGLALMSIGFAWVTRDTGETPYATLVWQMGFLGAGLGLVNASATEAIMDALPVWKAGVGSSVNDTTRELGGTLGVASMGSVFNAVYRGQIDASFANTPIPAEAMDAVRDSVGMAMGVVEQVGSLASRAVGEAARLRVESAFLDGMHASSWLACVGTLAGATVVVLLIPRRDTAHSEQIQNEPAMAGEVIGGA